MDVFADRRRYPRLEKLVSVRIVAGKESDPWLSTRDVSAGGMRLLSDRPLEKGEPLDLEMLLPDGSWLRVVSKVAWSVKLDVGSAAEYEVGLRFVELTPDDRARLTPLLPPSPFDSHHPDGYVRDT